MIIKLNSELGKKLIYFQLIYNLLIKFLISPLGFPSILNYLTDIVTLLLLIIIADQCYVVFKEINYRSALWCIALFSLAVLIGAEWNLVKPALLLWAIRNTFRFYVFFLACIVLLTSEDVDRIFAVMIKFQVLNIVLCLYEYFVLGAKQDHLGGIFGTAAGCNGALNLYFCILLAYGISGYLADKISLVCMAFLISSTAVIAAFSELKIFYVEFIIITAVVMILSRPTLKTIFLVLMTIGSLLVGLNILKEIFPRHYAVLMDPESFVQYFASEGTDGYNISRMNAFSQLNELFFKNDLWKNLFGYGFGNCEISTYNIFKSEFYKNNQDLNYGYFSHVMVFLETGYMGIVTYILFFADGIRYALVHMGKLAKKRFHGITAAATGIIVIMNLWYNNAMRIEYAYMVYFVLSIAAIGRKSSQE